MGRINRKKGIKVFCCFLIAVAVVLTNTNISLFRTATVAKAASPVVEKAISWAISVANNNSHGYSQTSRWGPDYDCSSFVITAFRNAGVNVGAATYTGNMRTQFTQHGFQWIPWSQIGGISNLQRGDILLNEVQHTEIYLGNSQNVGAHSNRGYPQTGDQTGTEVSVSGYYYHPWNGVLRYVGSNVCTCSTDYAGDYYVSTNSLPLTMRSGHGTGYSAVTSIPKGSKVYVSRTDGNWGHVEWNGYSGYCSMSYLTKIASKNYNLHVWVSDAEMGGVPSNFIKGKRYYICYELIDESTGKRANETSNINYTATETVRNSSEKVCEYSYKNSDYNWIWIECGSEDTYTGTVTISGDVEVSCSVSFDVYADTSPQMKIWTWDGDDSKEISTMSVGKTAYCSYLVRDKYTGKNLNDVTSYWTQGDGYTVTIKVYDPSGSLIKTKSYKNNDCTWISFVPDKIGYYKIKASVTGNLSGDMEKTIKAEEKEHKYGSWTITKKATCTQTGTKTRTCSICSAKQYETIPAAGHKIVTDKAIEPTETKDGLTEGTHCSVCGKVITIQKIIPSTGSTSSPTPSPTRTPKPTAKPTLKPTVEPTIKPTVESTVKPTSKPEVTDGPDMAASATPTSKTDAVSTRKPTEAWDIEEYSDSYDEDESDEAQEPVEGTILKNRKSGVSYKVLEQGETVAFYKVNNKRADKIVVPDAISVDGVKYKVTAISSNAFNGCKKLKYAVIGKNVSVIGNKAFFQCKLLKKITIPAAVVKIGRKAFYGCKKLKLITVKSRQLKSRAVGTQAFGSIYKKVIVKVPKNQRKTYAKWLRKKGISKMAKIVR